MTSQMHIAYLAPVDADTESYAHWIIAPDITAAARAIPSRHVLVIADSCYSGMLVERAARLQICILQATPPMLAMLKTCCRRDRERSWPAEEMSQ